MQRVYLDQNAWVRLARAHNGLDDDALTMAALNAIRKTLRLGVASYPLSWIHYFETYRKRDPAARRRLGTFMAEISDFHSIAGAGTLLQQEVAAAVARLQGRPEPLEPRIFGRGHAHAFGRPDVDLSEEPFRLLVAQHGDEAVRNMIELEMLRGPDVTLPHGDMQAPQHIGSQRQLELEHEVENNLAIHGRDGDLANRIVLAQEALVHAHVLPALVAVDRLHSLDADRGDRAFGIRLRALMTRGAPLAISQSCTHTGSDCRSSVGAHLAMAALAPERASVRAAVWTAITASRSRLHTSSNATATK